MNKLYFLPLLLVSILVLLAGCGGTDEPQFVIGGNNVPIADAGLDRNVITGLPVILDGSGSSDLDGDVLSYQWTLDSKPAGSTAFLSMATEVSPIFTPDVHGVYSISLVVNDGLVNSSVYTVTITSGLTANNAPIADAGRDKNVVTGLLVKLNGSNSYDPDGDALSYQWSLESKPVGSASFISSATEVKPSFTPDVHGTYLISLVVNDGLLDSAADKVTITAASTANNVPIADAGADKNVITGIPVTLNGSDSYDPDGDPIAYNWTLTSKPASSTAFLSSSTVVNPSFTPDIDGVYIVSLVVSDGTLVSSPDTIFVRATTSSSVTDYDIVGFECPATATAGQNLQLTVHVINRSASDPGVPFSIREVDVLLGDKTVVSQVINEAIDGGAQQSTAFTFNVIPTYQVITWYAYIMDEDYSDFDYAFCNTDVY